ncbi:FG-GAP repeat protein [Symmachiella dynata]|uniref:FG-GAP repeat domain-containing protein n=1 Tax=Symmachiella dynata TaxID=2527995 RepID=UPI001188AFDC|nr:VCBS repeat-containing protein [Symmachiella dynata]QDT46469.1 FG-GAP repeat protein [Symmachiella dynata]
MRWNAILVLCASMNAGLLADVRAADPPERMLAIRVTVTSELPFAHVPLDPEIDFAAAITELGATGVLDPDSITVHNLATGQTVPHALREDFAHGDRGRVEWVVGDPAHTKYEIRFRSVAQRPGVQVPKFTPQIGTGDLLRYNAGVGRPISPSYLSRLIDINGDGRRDLLGCWNYAYRAGEPWDGIIAFPRVGVKDELEFGELTRLRYLESAAATEPKHFSSIYMRADFADFNHDGLIDVVYSPRRGDELHLYLNSGRNDAGGWPKLVAAGSVSRQGAKWGTCRAVDLNGDGAVDFVVGDTYLKNTNPEGWPMQLATAATIDAGQSACFLDIDEDGQLDAVCLIDGSDEDPRARRVAWRKYLGGDPPTFAAAERLRDIDVNWCSELAAVPDGPRRGLLVQHDVYQRVSFYEHLPSENGTARFQRSDDAKSKSAVLALSDQAWPCVCDWDGDGDQDLLVGGGYGWPRIVINEGTKTQPAYAEAKQILADGQPIQLLRDDILGGKHWHNMGYPFPVYADWDGDDLPDLILPNETNRIFWYKNIGTRSQPKFSAQRQILCDGFPDTPAMVAESARLAGDKSVPNQPYPYEKQRPFFWRTGIAVADFNGDGFADFVTHDGFTRKATLFAQYRDETGKLRLRKQAPLKLADGRLIDDAIVGRTSHWTESFRATDWNGDGLQDLIYSCAGTRPEQGSIYLLKNVGTATDPLFDAPRTLSCFGKPIKVTAHGPHPWVADMDGDGKPDVLTCVEWSVYPFFSHAAIEMAERPQLIIVPIDRRKRE